MDETGRRLPSAAEAQRLKELRCAVRVGGIRTVAHQPVFWLAGIEYRADFLIVSNQGKTIVEEVKGFETHEFKAKKKLWKIHGPCDLHILSREGGRWKNTVVKGGKAEASDD